MIYNCFIIMGFHTKTMEDGKEYNLDLSYEKIIRPVLDIAGIDYVRADEIMISELIDESMYRLLLCADLVIADITTLNPNALYELGVRYALKPYSTILIGDKNTKFPFDLSHLRIFTYEHRGDAISASECARMQTLLTQVIQNINIPKAVVDSPVYKYITGLIPPSCPSDHNYFKQITSRFKAGDNLCALVNTAYKQRERGDFQGAAKTYMKALAISKDEYIVKEIAVCLYQGGTQEDYIQALHFLREHIDVDRTTNPEILKALGTIYKHLWINSKSAEFAKRALAYYEKSFVLYATYNSGLNYGLMLLAVATNEIDSTQRNSYILWAKHIYSQTERICLNQYAADDYWINASLEECSVAQGDNKKYEKYSKLSELSISFMGAAMGWKRQKTLEQIALLKKLLNDLAL